MNTLGDTVSSTVTTGTGSLLLPLSGPDTLETPNLEMPPVPVVTFFPVCTDGAKATVD